MFPGSFLSFVHSCPGSLLIGSFLFRILRGWWDDVLSFFSFVSFRSALRYLDFPLTTQLSFFVEARNSVSCYHLSFHLADINLDLFLAATIGSGEGKAEYRTEG